MKLLKYCSEFQKIIFKILNIPKNTKWHSHTCHTLNFLVVSWDFETHLCILTCPQLGKVFLIHSVAIPGNIFSKAISSEHNCDFSLQSDVTFLHLWSVVESSLKKKKKHQNLNQHKCSPEFPSKPTPAALSSCPGHGAFPASEFQPFPRLSAV